MECPDCKKTITAAAKCCESCGFEYPADIRAMLSVVFEVSNDVEALNSTLKTEILPGLQRISGKMDLLKKTVSDDLKLLTPEEKVVPAEMPKKAEAPTPPPEPRKEEPLIIPKKEPVAPPKPSFTPPTPRPAYPTHEKSKDSSEFEIRLGQKWLLIVGIVTMVFGIGYFLKYSFDRGWIGPAGRVAMAYFWGLILLAGGNRVRKQFETFGFYVIGGGIATLYFSTFAGFQIYHLFGLIPAFGLMIMITALACVLAIVHNTKWLAVLGLVGGFFTPVMLSTGQDAQIALMTYIVILNLGLLSIAFYKKWDLLNYLGFAFTY